MSKIIAWIKEHPKLSAALGLSLILLFYLISRRNAAAATASTDAASQGVAGTGLSGAQYLSLQEAGLAASTQLQGLQIQAGVQTSAQDAELQAAQANYANQLAIAQLNAQVQLQNIQSTASSTDTATNAALQAALSTTGAQVQVAQISAGESVDIAQLQTQVQLAQIAATNTANTVIGQLAGIIAGQQPTTAGSTAPPPTTTVVASKPTTDTTGGVVAPVTTSPPVATVTSPAGPAPDTSSLIPYSNLTSEQWYELIALETNQPLASVQANYGATAAGSSVTNLQSTVAAHSTAQSAYNYYAGGQVVYNPHGAYSFEWAPAFVGPTYSYLSSANPWSVPSPTVPTGSPVATS